MRIVRSILAAVILALPLACFGQTYERFDSLPIGDSGVRASGWGMMCCGGNLEWFTVHFESLTGPDGTVESSTLIISGTKIAPGVASVTIDDRSTFTTITIDYNTGNVKTQDGASEGVIDPWGDSIRELAESVTAQIVADEIETPPPGNNH